MNPVFWWMIQTCLSVAVLIVLIWCISFGLRHRPALRHALWLVVLFKFVTPSPVAWPISLIELKDQAIAFLSSKAPALVADNLPPVDSPDLNTHPVRDVAFVPVDSPVSTEQEFTSTQAPEEIALVGQVSSSQIGDSENGQSHAETADGWRNAVSLFLGIWLLGCVSAAAIQFRRIIRQKAIVRRGRDAPKALSTEVTKAAAKLGVRPVPTLVVPVIRTPFLWCFGWLRIMWPEALAEESTLQRARGIIAHELAHVRRRDHWVAWIEMVAGIIWWWNPLFWFVRRRLRESAEMACDAIALSIYDDRRAYAEIFLELSSSSKTGMPAPALGVSTGTPSSFERRLTMILNDRVSGKLSVRGFLLVGCIAAITLPTLTLAQVPSDGQKTEDSRSSEKVDDSRSNVSGFRFEVPSIGPPPRLMDFALAMSKAADLPAAQVTGVPILGDIPHIGRLFASTEKESHAARKEPANTQGVVFLSQYSPFSGKRGSGIGMVRVSGGVKAGRRRVFESCLSPKGLEWYRTIDKASVAMATGEDIDAFFKPESIDKAFTPQANQLYFIVLPASDLNLRLTDLMTRRYPEGTVVQTSNAVELFLSDTRDEEARPVPKKKTDLDRLREWMGDDNFKSAASIYGLPGRVQVLAKGICVELRDHYSLQPLTGQGAGFLRPLIAPDYLKEHNLQEGALPIVTTPFRKLDEYRISDDLRTIFCVVDNNEGGKEVYLMRVVFRPGEKYLQPYILPGSPPNSETGFFAPWFMKAEISSEPAKYALPVPETTPAK